jgi:hypothetical protein
VTSAHRFVETSLPASGDLHPKEIQADHQTKLSRGRANMWDGALERERMASPDSTDPSATSSR